MGGTGRESAERLVDPMHKGSAVIDSRSHPANVPDFVQLERFYLGVERRSRFASFRPTPVAEVLPEGLETLRTTALWNRWP